MILITGAALGLGREVALELAKSGFSVLIHYNQNRELALEVALECKNLGVESATLQGDFSTNDSLAQFLQRLEPFKDQIRGLVNNVGNYLIAPPSQTSLAQWQDLFQTNLHAPFILTRALVPSICQHQGAIVNIGVTGLMGRRANTYATAYAITKSGLYDLTLAFAKELAKDHVRVNMVSPGFLERSVDLSSPQALPMRRAASLKEVAELVAYLFKEESSYITGQNIEVAGGVGL